MCKLEKDVDFSLLQGHNLWENKSYSVLILEPIFIRGRSRAFFKWRQSLFIFDSPTKKFGDSSLPSL